MNSTSDPSKSPKATSFVSAGAKPPKGAGNTSLGARSADEDRDRCRVCGVVLTTRAEAKIGVHIRCIFERKQAEKLRVPRPRYKAW